MVWANHVEDAAVSVMAECVKRERRFIGKEPELCIMDAKGGRFRIDKERDEDWFVRFRQLGLDYVPNDEPAPLEELDEWLRPVWDPVLEQMVSRLMITERVAELPQGPMWALQRFQWNPVEMSTRQLLGQPGKDYVDCVKYFVNQKSINRGRSLRDRKMPRAGRAKDRASSPSHTGWEEASTEGASGWTPTGPGSGLRLRTGKELRLGGEQVRRGGETLRGRREAVPAGRQQPAPPRPRSRRHLPDQGSGRGIPRPARILPLPRDPRLDPRHEPERSRWRRRPRHRRWSRSPRRRCLFLQRRSPLPRLVHRLQDPGLRTTVVAVVTALAELGLIQVPGAGAAGKPPLPADLHPGAAPVVVGGEMAGAWSPPPRPGLEGPRSAVRRAFYDMLAS